MIVVTSQGSNGPRVRKFFSYEMAMAVGYAKRQSQISTDLRASLDIEGLGTVVFCEDGEARTTTVYAAYNAVPPPATMPHAVQAFADLQTVCKTFS